MEPITVDKYHDLIESEQLPESTSIELINGFLTLKDRSAAGENPMVVGNDHILSDSKNHAASWRVSMPPEAICVSNSRFAIASN